MNRNYLNQYILDTYGVEPEYPWIKYPDYAVYRHQTNGKWFAVIMEIPRGKIGMEGNEIIPVANLKCDPLLIGSLVHEHGVFPGYHMIRSTGLLPAWMTVFMRICSKACCR